MQSVRRAFRNQLLTKKNIAIGLATVWLVFSGFFWDLEKKTTDMSDFIDVDMIENFDQSFSSSEFVDTMKSFDNVGDEIAEQSKANFSSNYQEIDPDVIVEMKKEGLMKKIISIIIDYIFN